MTAGTRPGPGSPQEEEAVEATIHLTTATETHTEEGDTDPAPMGVIMVETALPHMGTLKVTW